MNPTKVYELEEEGKLLNSEDTFSAKIHVGCYDTEEEIQRPVAEVKASCQEFVEEDGLCVNVQETFYQYGIGGEGGNEMGAVVELIQYPRFPKTEELIANKALQLAEILMERMNQKRVSVITTNTTYTLQNPEHKDVQVDSSD